MGVGAVMPPVIGAGTWILAALDPVLVAVAVGLGWNADQFGKVFIAVIAALAASVLVGWIATLVGLPWPAPIGPDHPTLLPVRTIAALVWAMAAFGARRLVGR